MATKFKLNLLACSVALVIAGCGGSDKDDTPVVLPPVTEADPLVPVISPEVKAAAAKLAADAKVLSAVAEWNTALNTKERFNQHMELTRIASPSREEYNRAREIKRRMVEEWGFLPTEIKTTNDGFLPGAELQLVDGLPVYNVCAEIKGTYSSTPGAATYNGQYPKILVEGHIDTVNPDKLTYRHEPIKLQPASAALVNTPAELAALPDELKFIGERIIEDTNYIAARKYYATSADATAANALRLYVPGISDAMGNASSVMNIAKAMKKYNIKPVYDIWFCGTAGEEGKGNLAGMKQLYGYDQNLGTGSNPLNFVTNFSIDGGGGTINFLGSYRFEMKYKAPTTPGANAPSALEAAGAAIARIADVKTPWDTDKKALKTTYTVGVASCEASVAGVVPSCTIQVDMRSPRLDPLKEIRAVIEPMFQRGLGDENARYGAADGSGQAVTMELTWFGDRPPHERTNLSDVSIQAAYQSAQTVGVDKFTKVSTASSSLNDNVPAAMGVPTINLSGDSTAAGGGGHAFNEWAIPGASSREVLRMQRIMTAALIASGFTAADGTVTAPAAPTIGARTAQVK